MGIDPSAVVPIVDDLARKGLVRREPHPEDRRSRRIVATEDGLARLEDLRLLARAVDDELLADLTAEERRVLLKLLQRVAHP
ncbi:MarR family winged helix-turn-helix transcriptional regulator [Amycolatopsis thermoflava]|uniref:MarR family winged helix-turn-helix transcriptional regulator n=1 Tax=Amycolatopsis thermoflava TaxID=84480 RepID=UPI001E4A7C58|nr:MarR family transcriptional regulator [Amycolatopsis thermoflava]